MKLLKISKKVMQILAQKTLDSKNLKEISTSIMRIREIPARYRQSRKSTNEK